MSRAAVVYLAVLLAAALVLGEHRTAIAVVGFNQASIYRYPFSDGEARAIVDSLSFQ